MACAGRPRLLQVVLSVLIKDLLIRRQLTLLPPVIVLISIVMVILMVYIGVYAAQPTLKMQQHVIATQTVITTITQQDLVQITSVCILVVLVIIWVTVLLPTQHALLMPQHPKTLQAGRTAAGVVYQVLIPAVHMLLMDVIQ